MYNRPSLINATLSQLSEGEEIIWEDHACYQSFKTHKILPPLLAMGFLAVCSSWAKFGPFMAINLPPGFKNGRQ